MAYALRPQVLDKIRADHGLSSDEHLARELKLSLGTISGIRRGRTPSFATAIKILEAANITDIRAALVSSKETLAA